MFTKQAKCKTILIIIFSSLLVSNAFASMDCKNCMKNILQDLKSEQWVGVANWRNHIGQPNSRMSWLKLKDNAAYIGVLGVATALSTAILAWSTGDAIADNTYDYWWSKLTHLTLCTGEAYQIMALYNAIKLRNQGSALPTSQTDKMPGYAKASQIMQSIAIPSSLLVTVLYWLLVHDPSKGDAHAISYMTHGGAFLLNGITHFSSNQPYFMRQGVFFMAYGLAYLAWTGIHHAADLTDEDGNNYLYKAINWNEPESSGIMATVLSLAAMPLTHLSVWFMSNIPSLLIKHNAASITP